MNDGIGQDRAYASRLAAEDRFYRDDVDVHNLPAIFHYWSNRYVKPKLEAFGFSDPEGMFRKYLGEQCRRDDRNKRFVSFGSGNCNLEIDFAVDLRAQGHSGFVIDCVDLNPAMLERGRISAAERSVAAHIHIVEMDFNEWKPEHEYDAVIANQALHHVLKVEELFAQIKRSLTPGGTLIVSDMIGRNGHQRWPEALGIVLELWRKLPPSYRYNRKLDRYEEMYQNYDCSGDGFEAIRSEDILPLLLQNFHFHLFVAFANVIEPFVDRAFGDNFDADAAWDRAFIDAVHQRDEQEFASGRLKPTHMLAVLGTQPDTMLFHAPLTPQFSLRSAPAIETQPNDFKDPYEWGSWPHSPQKELEIACRRLEEAFQRLKDVEDRVTQRGEMVLELTAEFEQRTQWALELNREVEERTEWALALSQQVKELQALDGHLQQLDGLVEERTNWALALKTELEQVTSQCEERTNWALDLNRELEIHKALAEELTAAVDKLEWAKGLDRRFHAPLSTAVRAVRRLRTFFRAAPHNRSMQFPRDLRLAIRTLTKSPGFALVAIVTLALGIGANTAIFSIINGVLLAPLPYPDANRIVAVSTYSKPTGRPTPRLTGGDLVDIRADGQIFEAFSSYYGGEMGVQLRDRAEFTSAFFVNPDFFRVFGVQPVSGRLLDANDVDRAAVVEPGVCRAQLRIRRERTEPNGEHRESHVSDCRHTARWFSVPGEDRRVGSLDDDSGEFEPHGVQLSHHRETEGGR